MLAAAITATAPIIVTFNLKHFPNATLALHGVRAVHPDEFALSLYEADSEAFIALVKSHRPALINPPKTAEAYLDKLCRRLWAVFSLRSLTSLLPRCTLG